MEIGDLSHWYRNLVDHWLLLLLEMESSTLVLVSSWTNMGVGFPCRLSPSPYGRGLLLRRDTSSWLHRNAGWFVSILC
jgi:hypothetical protein